MIIDQRSVSTKDLPPLARPPTVPLSQQPVMHLQHHSTATTSPASIQLVQQYPWSFQTQPSTIHDPVLISQQAVMYSQHRSTATTSPSSIQLAQQQDPYFKKYAYEEEGETSE